MNIYVSIVGILFVSILLLPSAEAADDSFFTKTYDRISNTIDETTAERVAAILNADPEDVLLFREEGSFRGEKTSPHDDSSFLDVCQYTSEKGAPITRSQLEECIRGLNWMWNHEREFVREEIIESEKSTSFSRWWDGQLDGSEDFDIYADIHMIDRQFFGKKAEREGLTSVPTVNKGVRKSFSLADSDFHLPQDELPFQATGGCDSGETSLYGGLVCLPKFCTDFACVKVTAVPGRASVSRSSSEASIENFIIELENVSNYMNDSPQLTPTLNSTQPYFWSQLFNFDQLLKSNLTIASRPPPVLSDFEAPHRQEKELDTSQAEGKQQSEKVLPLIDEKTGEIWKELNYVRRDLFDACGGAVDCKSEDGLVSYFSDCSLLQSRSSAGLKLGGASTCADEAMARLEKKRTEDFTARMEMIRNIKVEFYQKAPGLLNGLWKEIQGFEKRVMSVNLCKIREAKLPCGSLKMDCSVKGSQ